MEQINVDNRYGRCIEENDNDGDGDGDGDDDDGARENICVNPADKACFISGGNPKKSIKQ